MPAYESKQVAVWGLWLAGAFAFAGIALGVWALAAGRPTEAAFCALLLLVALLVSNFAVLTVRVGHDDVSWSFAAGLVGRRIPLADVRAVEVRRSPWYWGWGIRWTPRGWLWRSSGLDAVWIERASGKRVGVGSPQPEELARAIGERLALRG